MKPEPPPTLRVQTESDPLRGAVGEAMHDATICLWRDLWEKVEKCELLREDLAAVADALDEMLDRVPSKAMNKRWFRARLQRARATIETLG